MICDRCGKQIDDDSTFCPFCGAKQQAVGARALSADGSAAGANAQKAGSQNNNIIAPLGLIFTFLVPLAGVGLCVVAACMRKTSPGWRLVSTICIFLGVALQAVAIALTLFYYGLI